MSDKKAAGQARKAETASAKKDSEQAKQQDAEDADWEAGAKGKNKKGEAAEVKAAAAAERKALAKAQEEEENSSMAVKPAGKGKKGGGAPKMTRAEIAAKVRAAVYCAAERSTRRYVRSHTSTPIVHRPWRRWSPRPRRRRRRRRRLSFLEATSTLARFGKTSTRRTTWTPRVSTRPCPRWTSVSAAARAGERQAARASENISSLLSVFVHRLHQSG